jgi:hypothetical protein
MKSWLGREKLGVNMKFFSHHQIFTPPKSPIKEETNGSVMFSGQTHLEVNGVVHAYIVK